MFSLSVMQNKALVILIFQKNFNIKGIIIYSDYEAKQCLYSNLVPASSTKRVSDQIWTAFSFLKTKLLHFLNNNCIIVNQDGKIHRGIPLQEYLNFTAAVKRRAV